MQRGAPHGLRRGWRPPPLLLLLRLASASCLPRGRTTSRRGPSKRPAYAHAAAGESRSPFFPEEIRHIPSIPFHNPKWNTAMIAIYRQTRLLLPIDNGIFCSGRRRTGGSSEEGSRANWFLSRRFVVVSKYPAAPWRSRSLLSELQFLVEYVLRLLEQGVMSVLAPANYPNNKKFTFGLAAYPLPGAGLCLAKLLRRLAYDFQPDR